MTSTVARRLSVHLFVSLWATVLLFQLSQADVGIGARYQSPYFPSACYGNDASRYPPTNLFAAAGEGIWDNGAACGRRYLVRCVSAAVPRTCVPGQTIQIKIVDRALTSVSRPSSNGATIVLSTPAFAIIADSSATSIIIEFKQV